MDMKTHEILEQRMKKELDKISGKYASNPNMELTTQDLCFIKDLYSALMKQSTWIAMKEEEEYGNEGWSSDTENGEMGNSGRRGRAANGRYVSRDMEPSMRRSYADGYSEGYSEAMNQMNGNNSGHYPMMYPPRRW